MRAPVWLVFFQGIVPLKFVIWPLCGGIVFISIALAIYHSNPMIMVGIALGALCIALYVPLLTRVVVATVIIFCSTFFFINDVIYVKEGRTSLHETIIASPFDLSIKHLSGNYSFNKEIEVLSVDKVAYKIRIFTVLSLKATEDEVIDLARKFDNPDKEMKDRVARILTQGSQEAFSELRSTDVMNTLQVSSAIVRKLPEAQLLSQGLVITRGLEIESIRPIGSRE